MIVYQSERATVHLGDARDELAELATESIDLVIADPPYGVEWQSGLRAEALPLLAGDGEHERDAVASILAECVRVVGQHRHLYVFGPADVLAGLKVTEPVPLIWNKLRPGAGDLAAPWAPAHEPISFLVSKHRHGGDAGGASIAARLRKGSVLSCAPPTGRHVRHPTEKPVALLCDLIESSSRAGEVVLDPCAGSGSTGVAAIMRGRRSVLVEIDERWAAMIVARVKAAEALAERWAGL